MIIIFFFNFRSLLCLFLIVVLVKIWVVFWNDVVDKNEFVLSEVFVILSRIGLVVVGCLFCSKILVFVLVNWWIFSNVFGNIFVLFVLFIWILCNIWCIIIFMCLLLIFIFCIWYIFWILCNKYFWIVVMFVIFSNFFGLIEFFVNFLLWLIGCFGVIFRWVL